jgi:hypothetical protein
MQPLVENPNDLGNHYGGNNFALSYQVNELHSAETDSIYKKNDQNRGQSMQYEGTLFKSLKRNTLKNNLIKNNLKSSNY